MSRINVEGMDLPELHRMRRKMCLLAADLEHGVSLGLDNRVALDDIYSRLALYHTAAQMAQEGKGEDQ